MNLIKINKNIFLAVLLSFFLAACATQKAAKIDSQIQGDVYTGTDTVKYLAETGQINGTDSEYAHTNFIKAYEKGVL